MTHAEGNQVTKLVDQIQRSCNHTPETYVPPAQEMERTMKLVQELENPSTSFRYGPKETQAISSAETSQSTKETHQEGQDKGMEHRMSSQEQMERMQAVMEELKANPNPNPELRERARKLLAESRQLTEQKSSERKEIDAIGPIPKPCLQWNLDTSRVTGKVIPKGDGTALLLADSFHVQNICSDPIDNILYGAIDNWQCPEGCVSSSGSSSSAFEGIPSSIGQNQFSAGIWDNQVWCVQSDNNGEPVYVPPASVTITASVQGQQKGSRIYGPEATFEVVS